MYDYEITPPPFLLDGVLSALNTEQVAPPTKVFVLPFRRIAIAAVTIGLIALTVIYFLRSESSSTSKNVAVKLTPSLPGANAVSPPATDKTDNKRTNPNISNTSDVSLSSDPIKKLVHSNFSKSQNGRNVKHSNLKNPVLAANAISPISVTAPPIYDDNGIIIMDENLVSAPDENYIIVTSPSGEQTKISRKFLKMLSVLNGGSDNNYMDAENFHWKMRFEEWRSKLLQQASYIPTANNFLDIMDLKEMLQEN